MLIRIRPTSLYQSTQPSAQRTIFQILYLLFQSAGYRPIPCTNNTRMTIATSFNHFPSAQEIALDEGTVKPFSCNSLTANKLRSLALYVIRLVAARLLWSYDFQICEETAKGWMNQKMYWALWYKPPLWLKVTPAKQRF